MEVDHLRLSAASLENRAVRAQRQDRTALDRHRLLEREAPIDSHDLAVVKNEIGIRGMHARGTGEEKGRNPDPHPPAASYTPDDMLWHWLAPCKIGLFQTCAGRSAYCCSPPPVINQIDRQTLGSCAPSQDTGLLDQIRLGSDRRPRPRLA